MYLHEIERGSNIFIDSNIFVYHFSKGSEFNKACTEFLVKVESGEIHGVTSAAVLQETAHRLMMVEASAILEVETRNLPKYLKQHPEMVKQLTRHIVTPSSISKLNIEVIPVTLKYIEKSQVIKIRYGLLSNDALTVAVMEDSSISALASNDSDFSLVEWIKLYLPLS